MVTIAPLLAVSLSAVQYMLLGVAVLILGFSLRGGYRNSRRIAGRNPMQEMRAEVREAESSYISLIRKMEIKLHDYAREVDGQTSNRIAILNRMIAEADRDIAQLRALLAESQAASGAASGAAPRSQESAAQGMIAQFPKPADRKAAA